MRAEVGIADGDHLGVRNACDGAIQCRELADGLGQLEHESPGMARCPAAKQLDRGVGRPVVHEHDRELRGRIVEARDGGKHRLHAGLLVVRGHEERHARRDRVQGWPGGEQRGAEKDRASERDEKKGGHRAPSDYGQRDSHRLILCLRLGREGLAAWLSGRKRAAEGPEQVVARHGDDVGVAPAPGAQGGQERRVVLRALEARWRSSSTKTGHTWRPMPPASSRGNQVRAKEPCSPWRSSR